MRLRRSSSRRWLSATKGRPDRSDLLGCGSSVPPPYLQSPRPKLNRRFSMSLQRKPSIVFVHGLWADGSCFSKLIPALQNEGFEVIASQHGLDSHASDVDCVRRTLGRVSNPAILVGHSYGG